MTRSELYRPLSILVCILAFSVSCKSVGHVDSKPTPRLEGLIVKFTAPEEPTSVFSSRRLADTELMRITEEAGLATPERRGVLVMGLAFEQSARAPAQYEYVYIGHVIFPPALASYDAYECRRVSIPAVVADHFSTF